MSYFYSQIEIDIPNSYLGIKLELLLLLPQFLQSYKVSARGLAPIAILRNMTLLAINMKATWQARFLKSPEQAKSCKNSGEMEDVCVLSMYNDG